MIDFLKVRAAWGQTGNDADVYRTLAYYIPDHISSGYGYLDTPLNGALGLTEYNRQPNNNLKPEKTSEWELGLTANFLSNRIGIDFAYYDKLTKTRSSRQTSPRKHATPVPCATLAKFPTKVSKSPST